MRTLAGKVAELSGRGDQSKPLVSREALPATWVAFLPVTASAAAKTAVTQAAVPSYDKHSFLKHTGNLRTTCCSQFDSNT